MNNITILGSTGFIGRQALNVVEASRGFNVIALTAHENVALLAQQVRQFKPKFAAIANESLYTSLKLALNDTATTLLAGQQAIEEIASLDETDIVVVSIVGIAALLPTSVAIKKGKQIALANKEAMVVAGSILNKSAEESGAVIIPVDSEHSAIFQCLAGGRKFKQLILTASGGPFFGRTLAQMERITPEQALAHPTWSMGRKITIDSATMFNKGLELLEAAQLFGTKNIRILIHRKSIIHSMVEFCDNTILAQLGAPDMRAPISYALHYPHRVDVGIPPCEFPMDLTLEPPDFINFPALKLAYDVLDKGGSYPICLNGANEKAVELFLDGKIGFCDIYKRVESAIASHKVENNPTLSRIIEIDKEVRDKF